MKNLEYMHKCKILFTGLISVVFSVLVFFVIQLLISKDFRSGDFIFAVVMVSGCVIIPAIGGTLIFIILNKKIKIEGVIPGTAIKIVVLFFVLLIGLLFWSVADVVMFNGEFSNLSFGSIKKDFSSEFLGFVPIVGILSVTIPLVYRWLSKK